MSSVKERLEAVTRRMIAGEIDAGEYLKQANALAAEDHAATFPNGCPGGMCNACFKRLGGTYERCPGCQRDMPVVRGVFLRHDAKVGGRAGYSRAHFSRFAGDCSGSGRRA